MTSNRSNMQNIQLYSWLIGGALCLGAAVVFWAVTDVNDLVTIENPIEETQLQIQPEKVTATANLGSLMSQVRPLQMTTRMVASGNHAPEFRGTKFVQDNQKNSTIEIFRATEEDVIKNFLLRQPERKKFIYIRLSGEDQAEQYVLGYGVYKQQAELEQQLAQLKLNLPASVQPHSVQISQYLPLVNDLGSDEMSAKPLYDVRLRSAPLPVIDETVLAQVKSNLAATTDSSRNTSTKTTVTVKDQQGNVVDVKRSQTVVKAVEKPAQTVVQTPTQAPTQKPTQTPTQKPAEKAKDPVKPKEPAKAAAPATSPNNSSHNNAANEKKAATHEISDPFN